MSVYINVCMYVCGSVDAFGCVRVRAKVVSLHSGLWGLPRHRRLGREKRSPSHDSVNLCLRDLRAPSIWMAAARERERLGTAA